MKKMYPGDFLLVVNTSGEAGVYCLAKNKEDKLYTMFPLPGMPLPGKEITKDLNIIHNLFLTWIKQYHKVAMEYNKLLGI